MSRFLPKGQLHKCWILLNSRKPLRQVYVFILNLRLQPRSSKYALDITVWILNTWMKTILSSCQPAACSYPVLETISLRILTASSLLMFSKFTSFTWWADEKQESLHQIISEKYAIFLWQKHIQKCTTFSTVHLDLQVLDSIKLLYIALFGQQLIQPACV